MYRYRHPSPAAQALAVLWHLLATFCQADAQLDRAVGTSTDRGTSPTRWDIRYLPAGAFSGVRLGGLAGDTLLVIIHDRVVAVPIDSLQHLRRENTVSRTVLGFAGALAGMAIGVAVTPGRDTRNCGHPCFANIGPPPGLLLGGLGGAGAGVVLAVILDNAAEYTFTGMPYAERMDVVSGIVGR